MTRRWMAARSARRRVLAGTVLVFAASRAFAQIGAISTQSLFFNQASNAHQGNYLEADAGVIYTNNVLLQSGSGGDTLFLLGLLGTTSHVGSRLDYHLDSDIALVKYLHSDFQTQPFGYLDGSGELRIVPGFFSWLARETYNQVAISPLAPLTPDNLEAINYVSTGPRFTLRPTLRTTIVVKGEYSYVDSSSKSPEYININNHRYGGDLTIRRAFSNTLSAYVTASTEKVEFTDLVDNTNFRQDQGLAGVAYTNARTVLDLSGGYTKLHQTGVTTVQAVTGARESFQKQTPSGTMWRAELSRLISPIQRVSLHALKQVTDAADLFRMNIDSPVPTLLPTRIVSGQPFTDREYGASWRLQENRTALQFDVLAISERYQATPISNHDGKLVSALFARQLSPVLNWDIGAQYEHDSYGFGRLNTINVLSNVRWRVGSRVTMRFIVAHSTVSPNGYNDNQVGVTVAYALLAPAPGSQNGESLQPVDPTSSQPPLRY